jgi:hypothetical protein
MTGTAERLAVLPGVRRHVRRVQEDLRNGRSCVWLLPTPIATPARVEQLLRVVREAVHVVVVDPPPQAAAPAAVNPPGGAGGAVVLGTIEQMLAGVFGTPIDVESSTVPEPPAEELTQRVLRAARRYTGLPVTEGSEPLTALADMRLPGGMTVAIVADEESDPAAVTALLRRYTAMVRGRHAHADQPVLLVVGSLGSLWDVEREDPLTTGVHWWWGVLSRLDLLTVATVDSEGSRREHHEAVHELCGDLIPEVIAEVAGPDIDLASELAREWDGTREGLGRLLAKRVEANAGVDVVAMSGDAAGLRPPPRLREHWSLGQVDAWGGRIRPSLRAIPGADLDQVLDERLWIGQSRALNPALDAIRRALVEIVRRGAPPKVLADMVWHYCGDSGVEAIELNNLRQAVRKMTISLTKPARELLDHAVGARNALAHRKSVDDRRLRELTRLVPLAVDGSRGS